MNTRLSTLLVAVASALIVSGACATLAQDVEWVQDRVESYFGTENAYRVTIESKNGIVSVIDVPAGVLLSVVASEYEAHGLKDMPEYPRLFRGDMTIRTRRYDEVKEGESRIGRDMMAEAPLEVSLQGVVVAVEIVE